MFHVRDGLFFERLNHEPGYGCGCVRIVKKIEVDGGPAGVNEATQFDMILDASTWASVVASMSALGENGTTHAMFETLQLGGRIDDSFYRNQPKVR